LDVSKIYSKEITLVTSYAASDKDTAKALSLIESSQIDVKQLVTHTYTIDNTQKAFDHARSGDNAMKIIITKWERLKKGISILSKSKTHGLGIKK